MSTSFDNDNDISNTHLADQYLTFRVSEEEYGVEILKIREIRSWSGATPLPGSPEFIRGVLNLRGTIIPILDLRIRFGCSSAELGVSTPVIVLQVETAKGIRTCGMVVDGVSDVHPIDSSTLQLPPDSNRGIANEFLRGLATVEDKLVILLDVDQLIESSITAH